MDFFPHRVFINHVDSFHGVVLSRTLADKYYGGGQPEETGEEMVGEEEERSKPLVPMEKVKYEIIGTEKNARYVLTEDVSMTIKEDDNLLDEIMKCGFVVFDITGDAGEIKTALRILQAVDRELEKVKEDTPKLFSSAPEKRVFILISSVLTWANTKPVDPDDPDVPFVDSDFKKRRPHSNYKQHIAAEKEYIQRGKKNPTKLITHVIAAGLTYGDMEHNLHLIFKKAWFNAPDLPVIHPGNNVVPLIHVYDLVAVVIALIESPPKKPKYMLAVEQTTSTQKNIVRAVSKAMGSGKIRAFAKSEAFLVQDMTQKYFDRMTVNLKMEPNYIVNDLGITFQSDMNFCENIDAVVREFKTGRKLAPVRILMHGPPAVGKTMISKTLCRLYDTHYISVASLVAETVAEMRANLESARAQVLARGAREEENEEEEQEEEEEDEEEDLETTIADMQERLKEIEQVLDENENGRLPDELIVEMMKSKLSSNPCQNQGYVLDGYPKTAEQTRQVFGISDNGGGDEDAEEEEEEGGERKIDILPQHVVSLEASDEFLCCRIMRMPERLVQGTHYAEERMAARLSQFRRNNTDDNTLLNIFDIREIHPLVIESETDIQERLVELITNKVGDKKGYPPSDEELEAVRLAEEAKRLEEERIAEEKRLALEEFMMLERQKNMELWIDMTHALQEHEEQMLAAQNEPLRQYLMTYVFPTLTKGLLEVSRIKPDDPIDFLAEYLFKQNPDGHMFDPAHVREADDLLDTIREYQHKVKEFLKLRHYN